MYRLAYSIEGLMARMIAEFVCAISLLGELPTMRRRYVTNFPRPVAQNHHFCAFVCCRLSARVVLRVVLPVGSQVPSAERGDAGSGQIAGRLCCVPWASSELTVFPGLSCWVSVAGQPPRPAARARCIASVRSLTWSLVNMLLTWLRTVLGERTSLWAIWLLGMPRARS